MAHRLSRRSIAEYIARGLVEGRGRQTLVLQLAAHLVQTRRTKELPLIIRDIEYILAENGVVVGTITSAFDLSAETKEAITAFVSDKTGAKSVSLDVAIDERVLGGVKITIPGRESDQTIAHQLTVLKTRFKKA